MPSPGSLPVTVSAKMSLSHLGLASGLPSMWVSRGHRSFILSFFLTQLSGLLPVLLWYIAFSFIPPKNEALFSIPVSLSGAMITLLKSTVYWWGDSFCSFPLRLTVWVLVSSLELFKYKYKRCPYEENNRNHTPGSEVHVWIGTTTLPSRTSPDPLRFSSGNTII